MSTEHVYTPPLRRLILAYYLLPIAASLVGWLVRLFVDALQGDPIDWIYLISWIAGFVSIWSLMSFIWIGLNCNWFVIKVDPTSISGGASLGGRKSILLSQIDRVRTQKQSWWHWLFHYRQIWDMNGKSISLSELYFPREQVIAILTEIGCE